MKFGIRLFWVILLACVLAWSAAAQRDPAASGKLIEVHTDGVRPAAKIALRVDRPAGFWTSNFPRLKGWQLPEGQEPIHVIDINAILLDGKADVIVSTYSGKRFREKVNEISRHQMVEGDSVTISEVKRFGYEPLTLKMVRVVPAMTNLPISENKTQSIRVWIDPKTSTLPSFTVRLVNDSTNAIWAVPWHTETGGRGRGSAIAQARFGNALIEPNGEHLITVRTHADEQVKFVIDAAVFEDGSVEGDAGAAATFHAFTHGRRTALERIVPILRSQLESPKIDVAKLIEQVDSVDGAPNTVGKTPTTISLEGTVEETVTALRRLQSVVSTRSEAEVRQGLTDFTDLYEAWLGRLRKYP
ncbi:MAG TPA: hypothetical protein VNA17_05305 [Pyrinomonadaceae bacterium]|nr:hypothetical protein [Pyrinomonadaceae bacterium]